MSHLRPTCHTLRKERRGLCHTYARLVTRCGKRGAAYVTPTPDLSHSWKERRGSNRLRHIPGESGRSPGESGREEESGRNPGEPGRSPGGVREESGRVREGGKVKAHPFITPETHLSHTDLSHTGEAEGARVVGHTTPAAHLLPTVIAGRQVHQLSHLNPIFSHTHLT
jgi:hypothetical protein